MIDEILRNNLIIREWVNGGLLPINASLVIVIGLFLLESWREAIVWHVTSHGNLHAPLFRESWHQFQMIPGVPTACALMWVFGADAARAGAAWTVIRNLNNVGPPPIAPGVVPEGLMAINVAFILAGLIGIAASLRCMFLFTPPWLGHWYWIGTVIVTLAFQVAT